MRYGVLRKVKSVDAARLISLLGCVFWGNMGRKRLICTDIDFCKQIRV